MRLLYVLCEKAALRKCSILFKNMSSYRCKEWMKNPDFAPNLNLFITTVIKHHFWFIVYVGKCNAMGRSRKVALNMF